LQVCHKDEEKLCWSYCVYMTNSEISIYEILLFVYFLYLKFINVNCTAVVPGYLECKADNPSRLDSVLVAQKSLYGCI